MLTQTIALSAAEDGVFVDQIWWYTSRAAGSVAWVLLSASVLMGLTLSSRDSRVFPTGWSIDLHRFLSTLSITFLGVHMAALVPDNFVHFSWAELFVPFASEWQPGAVAWGVVGAWLLVAVEVTSLLRKRMPTRLWRAIHMLSFIVWLAATVHLFVAGTDSSTRPFRVVQVVVIGAVTALFVRRIVVARRALVKSSARVRTLSVEEPVDVEEIDSGERAELST